jgi:hypothetical protein
MKEIIDSLSNLSQQIEKAKQQKSSLEGRQEEILRQLKGKFSIDTIEEAEDLLLKYEEEEKGLEKEINVKFTELRKQYSW